MEGCSVNHVRRILSGEKLFVSPSLKFIPYTYTPLYFNLSAITSKIAGIGFVPLRLISFISPIGCFIIIFLIVKRETGNSYSGILTSCLFAATFRIGGVWFDIARVDSLFLFLLLLAVYIIRFNTSRRSHMVFGLFVSLSFLTKQTALIIALPIMLLLVLTNWRRSLSLHSLIKSRLITFWINDIFVPLSIACIFSIFYLISQLVRQTKEKDFFYLVIAVCTIGITWFSRLNFGAYNNVLLPAYAVICILFGLATHKVTEFVRVESFNNKKLLELFLYLACFIQFATLIYNPISLIPSQKDLEAGRIFLQLFNDAEVFWPISGYRTRPEYIYIPRNDGTY